ncbi:MAG: hypothetical protein GOV01_03050 [Candidatus Altiarchaeota archaeon]|nr:hypothetical protein [Candidatus Altiarchaeota archaeon]
MMIKKCPACQSSLFKPEGEKMKCDKCGYIWQEKSMDFVSADNLKS